MPRSGVMPPRISARKLSEGLWILRLSGSAANARTGDAPLKVLQRDHLHLPLVHLHHSERLTMAATEEQSTSLFSTLSSFFLPT